jgi:hypothetical protein
MFFISARPRGETWLAECNKFLKDIEINFCKQTQHCLQLNGNISNLFLLDAKKILFLLGRGFKPRPPHFFDGAADYFDFTNNSMYGAI